MPNQDGDYVISADELDRIFREIYTRGDVDVRPQYYADAYMSGWEDGAKALHHEIVENADIILE